MRLARPPRGRADVARRSRHRLPPSRSLRPVRLPRRPRPGGLPLPHPLRRLRPEGPRHHEHPERPGARLLDQSGRAAPGHDRERSAPRRHRARPPAARSPSSRRQQVTLEVTLARLNETFRIFRDFADEKSLKRHSFIRVVKSRGRDTLAKAAAFSEPRGLVRSAATLPSRVLGRDARRRYCSCLRHRASCRRMGAPPRGEKRSRFPRNIAEPVLRAVRGLGPSRRRQHPDPGENPRRPAQARAADARDPPLLVDRRCRTRSADRRRVRAEGDGRRLDRQEHGSQRARDAGGDRTRQAQLERDRHRRRQRNDLPRRAQGRRPHRTHPPREAAGGGARHHRRNLEHLARLSRARLIGRFHRRARPAVLGRLHRRRGRRPGRRPIRTAAPELPGQAGRHRRIRLAERRLQSEAFEPGPVRAGGDAARLRHPRRKDRHGIQHRRSDRSAVEVFRRRRRALLGHSECGARTEIPLDGQDRQRVLLEGSADRPPRRRAAVAADLPPQPADGAAVSRAGDRRMRGRKLGRDHLRLLERALLRVRLRLRPHPRRRAAGPADPDRHGADRGDRHHRLRPRPAAADQARAAAAGRMGREGAEGLDPHSGLFRAGRRC